MQCKKNNDDDDSKNTKYSLFQQLLLSPHSTWLFQLKDGSFREEYRMYNVEHESILYPIAVSATALLLWPFFVCMAYISRHHIKDYVLSILVCFTDLAVAILGAMIGYTHYKIKKLKNEIQIEQPTGSFSTEENSITVTSSLKESCDGELVSNESAKQDPTQIPCVDTTHPSMNLQITQWYKILDIIRSLYLLFFHVAIVCYAFRRNFGTICSNEDLLRHHDGFDSTITTRNDDDLQSSHEFRHMLNITFCGNIPEHYFPWDSLYLLSVAPIMMTTAFPSIDILIIWIQLITSIATFTIICIFQGHLPPITFIVMWLVANIFIIAQLQLDKIHRFYMHLQLKSLLVQNEKDAEAFHVNEMRFLIANVAHDLKTVRNCKFLLC